jgi:hypothetical protein
VRTRAKLIVCAVALVVTLVGVGQPVAAGNKPWFPPNSDGGTTRNAFWSRAWGAWAANNGGGTSSTPEECDHHKLYIGDNGPVIIGQIKYTSSEISPGQWFVTVWCEWAPLDPVAAQDPFYLNGHLVNYWLAEPGDPQDLIADALALLQPTPPGIGTSPSGESPSGEIVPMVGIPTWFWLEGGLTPMSQTITDGPLSVTVTATPVKVTWDHGDPNAEDGDVVTCRDPVGVGAPNTDTCSYVYDHSSPPSFTVSATIEYTGSYQVFFNGTFVTGQSNIGGVTRVSSTSIAVQQAQAINTPG